MPNEPKPTLARADPDLSHFPIEVVYIILTQMPYCTYCQKKEGRLWGLDPICKSSKHELLFYAKDPADGPPTWDDPFCLCQAVKLSPAWDDFEDLPNTRN